MGTDNERVKEMMEPSEQRERNKQEIYHAYFLVYEWLCGTKERCTANVLTPEHPLDWLKKRLDQKCVLLWWTSVTGTAEDMKRWRAEI